MFFLNPYTKKTLNYLLVFSLVDYIQNLYIYILLWDIKVIDLIVFFFDSEFFAYKPKKSLKSSYWKLLLKIILRKSINSFTATLV